MNQQTKVRIVGIGAAGIRILNGLTADACAGAQLVAVDTDADGAASAKSAKRLHMAIDATSGRGTGGNTKLAKDAATQYIQYLAKIARHVDVLILTGGLGGGTASIVAPILSKLAEKPTTVISVFALPFELEGVSKRSLARKSFAFLRGRSAAAFAFENDVVLAQSGIGAEEALQKSNAKIAELIGTLASGFSTSAFLKIDPIAFAEIFAGKKIGAGFASAKMDNLDEAFDEIKRSPMMCAARRFKNALVAIKCPNTVSMPEIKQILRAAKDSLSVDDRIYFSVCAEKNSQDIKILAAAAEPDAEPVHITHTTNTTKETTPTHTAINENQQPTQPACIQPDSHNLSNATHTPEPISVINEPTADSELTDTHTAEIPQPSVDDEDAASIDENTQQTTRVDETAQAPAPSPVEFTPPPKSEPDAKKQTKEQMIFELDERGLFENTPSNERKGVDLDIPTFSRKRIKITTL